MTAVTPQQMGSGVTRDCYTTDRATAPCIKFKQRPQIPHLPMKTKGFYSRIASLFQKTRSRIRWVCKRGAC